MAARCLRFGTEMGENGGVNKVLGLLTAIKEFFTFSTHCVLTCRIGGETAKVPLASVNKSKGIKKRKNVEVIARQMERERSIGTMRCCEGLRLDLLP